MTEPKTEVVLENGKTRLYHLPYIMYGVYVTQQNFARLVMGRVGLPIRNRSV